MPRIGTCNRCDTDNRRLIACESNNLAVKVCEECYTTSSEGLMRYFQIPSDNLNELQARFKKLAKRAKKLNLPEPTFKQIEGEVQRVVRKNEITGLTEKVYLLHSIVVDPGISEVKVHGWTFVATIQHTDEGNIIRRVGDQEIPTKYRSVTTICEHCNTNRNRKDTYVLLNEVQKEYKQVGRNCLADFFGHDALMYAERAQYLCDILDNSESMEDFGFGGSSGPKYDPLEEYLSHVAQCIRMEGWLSKGRAKEMPGYVTPTATLAYWHYQPAARPAKFEPLYSKVEEDSVTLSNAAIEWASEIEGEDIPDYLHNIRTIARRGVIEDRDRGMGASIVAAYQRHLNQLRMKELAAKRAEIATHVGTVGERRRFKLYVENVITCDGAYGISYLHMMADEHGNVFKWFSSTQALEANKEYVIKGTIKKHDEFKGVKQNMLSRCEEVDLKTYWCFVEGVKHVIDDVASESEARKILRERLSLAKLPRGTFIAEQKKEEEGSV